MQTFRRSRPIALLFGAAIWGLAQSSLAASTLQCHTARAPSDAEVALLKEVNLARTAPATYAAVLAKRLFSMQSDGTYLTGGARYGTAEGRSVIEEAVVVLAAQAPLEPLALSSCVSEGARDHVVDQGPFGLLGHSGSDGSRLSDRATRHVSGTASCGENISYGLRDPADIVAAQLIDDGVPSRGHRVNLLDRNYKTIGLVLGAHNKLGWMADMLLCLNDVRDGRAS